MNRILTTKLSLLLALLAMLLPSTASAYNFMVDGLCYNKNSDGTSVTVTFQNTTNPRYSSLSGDVNIPAQVTYSGASYSVTAIGNYAFYGCDGLTGFTIPSSITSIGNEAFRGCDGLTNVTIPASVTWVGKNAFTNCTNMQSVNWNVKWKSNYTGYSSSSSAPFSGSHKIEKFTIGDGVEIIPAYLCYGCIGLTNVTIPNSVTFIGADAFTNTAWFNAHPDGLVYAGLVAYKYKGNMPSGTIIAIKDGTKVINPNCFNGCNGLASVTIPNSVIEINHYAFNGFSGLTSISIPSSVTCIGDNAFNGCFRLTSVTIPSSVTSIGNNAFKGCNGLTSITIPNAVSEMGEYAFRDCI